MSGGVACRCAEKKRPVSERDWEVLQYRCNHSLFNGGRRTPSAWSEIRCRRCSAVWRTRAAYVRELL